MLKSGRSTFSNCVSILSITGVIALVLAGNPASDFAYADSKEKPDTMDARLQRLEAR